MEQTPVKFGIVGLGTIARRFAAVLNTSSRAELFAVAARDSERAQAFAAEFHAEKVYGNYDELLCDPEVELIYLATTHNAHYELAKRCLEHGKAVLCEKPFFLKKAEAEELIALARSKQLFLMEAMWTRLLPVYRGAKAWVQEGKIGEIRFIDAQFSFSADYDPKGRLYDPDAAGGAVYDAGVYPIEFATGFLGKPVQIQSLSRPAPTGVDAFDVIAMRFANGALASLVCGIDVKTNPDAGIYGTNGKILVRDFVFGKRSELYDAAGNLVDSIDETAADGFIYEIEQAAELFRSGVLESPDIPYQDTIDCAGVFEELMRQWG